MHYASFFSSDYEKARARFRASIEAAGGRHEAYPIGLDGPDGEPLTIDIGRVGPEQLTPDLERVGFSLAPGQPSEVVENDRGFWVLVAAP